MVSTRDVIRNQTNIYDGAFCKNSQQLLTVSAKKLHRRYWTGF